MPWGVAIAAGISAVGAYASSEAQQSASEDAQEREIEAQKELMAEKRKFDLEDRAYRQGAVGNWAKYAKGYTASEGEAATAGAAGEDGALNGGAVPVNGPNIPWQKRSLFARPQTNGRAPDSLWNQYVSPTNGE